MGDPSKEKYPGSSWSELARPAKGGLDSVSIDRSLLMKGAYESALKLWRPIAGRTGAGLLNPLVVMVVVEQFNGEAVTMRLTRTDPLGNGMCF